jgi:voltage-gated potassium channel Kch
MARGLDEAGIEYTVIDIDSERIAAARKLGRVCIHGDASNPIVLATVGIDKIKVMAVTFPDPVAVVNAAKTALELNPKIKVVARVHREREAKDLHELGEIELISPEYEASVEFVKRTLTSAGWQQKDINKAIRSEKDIEFPADNEHK